MNKKGFVLLHVIVLALIVATVTAGMTRMLLMNYMATQRSIRGGQNRKHADALLHRAISTWNASEICSDIGPGLACQGAPGNCNCFCPDPVSIPRVTARDVGGRCQITVISSDSP